MMCSVPKKQETEDYKMENGHITITMRKDGRYMGKFCIGCDESGRAMYQYVYGKTYDEAERKVLIGREVAARFLSGKCKTFGSAYQSQEFPVQRHGKRGGRKCCCHEHH